MRAFRDLPDFILAPLRDKDERAWFAAPPGKWSPAEIVDHLATAIENSAKGFASRADKPAMTRRPRSFRQRFAQHIVLRTGWFPRGRQAPEMTRPAVRPERSATEAKLRSAVESFLQVEKRLLPMRAATLFLKHPVMGDLTFGEFMQFHIRHAEHHRKQILARLRR